MRALQKLVHDLKAVVEGHRPGDTLKPPEALPRVEIRGRRLTFAADGLDKDELPPVVLLHGFGGFFMDWPRVMAPIARHTRVYALDLPGWGFSEPHEHVRSLEDDVAAVGEFLTKMGLSRVILCGLSYGAGVAWAAAAMNLPRVSRVVALNPMPPHPLRFMHSPVYRSIFFLNSHDTVAKLGHRLMTKYQYKMICRENLLNQRLLDTFYLDLAYMVIKQPKMPLLLGAHAQGARKVDWSEWEHRLAGVRVPVTIMQGREDKIFSLASARYLHRLIPTSELIEIADCGHAMVFDQHRKVSDLIIKHVQRPQRDPANEPAEKTLREA